MMKGDSRVGGMPTLPTMHIIRKASMLVLGYALLLITNILSRGLSLDWLNYITKPLLMPLLAWLFWQKTRFSRHHNRLILLALAAAWLGDVLLMLPQRGTGSFVGGLLAFLVTHVLYSRYFFMHIRRSEVVRIQWVNLVTVLSSIYAFGYFVILMPYLNQMVAPVALYTFAISLMLILSNLFRLQVHQQTGQKFLAGSLLFVLSDSLLAYSLFVSQFPLDGVWIMLTYGMAQALIVAAAIDYDRELSRG